MIELLSMARNCYDGKMDTTPDTAIRSPQKLRAELDRSRDDLAAGRTRPLGAVLTAIHGRSSTRIETRLQTAQEAVEQG